MSQIDYDIISNSSEVDRIKYLNTLSDRELEEVENKIKQIQQPSGDGVGKRFAKGLARGAGRLAKGGMNAVGGALKHMSQGATDDPFGNLGVGKIPGMFKGARGTNEIKVMNQRYADVSKRINNPLVSVEMKNLYKRDLSLWERHRNKFKQQDRRTQGWLNYFNRNLRKIEQAVGIQPAINK